MALAPGALHRRFISIPQGATWAEVCVKRVDDGRPHPSADKEHPYFPAQESEVDPPFSSPPSSLRSPKLHNSSIIPTSATTTTPMQPFYTATSLASHSSPLAISASDKSFRQVVVHAMQVARGVSPKGTSEDAYLRLGPGEADGLAFELFPGGKTLEVVLGQFWSSLGSSLILCKVVFHGVAIDGPLWGRTSTGFLPLTVTPLLHDVVLKPSGKLTEWVSTLEPLLEVVSGGKGKTGEDEKTNSKSLPSPRPLLSNRDSHINGKPTWCLTVKYKLSLSSDVTGATLSLPTTTGLLYEAGFESQFICVVNNETGRLVAASDAFPESLKLKKGEYGVILEVKHEDSGKLNALKATGMLLEFKRKLDKEVALSFTT